MADNELFFFYGSLLSGLELAVELGLADRVAIVDVGTAAGRLVDLGGYPGLIEDDGGGRVLGEVVRIELADLARTIDHIELASGYDRVWRSIEGRSGVWQAWLYRYVGAHDGRWVAGGDWRTHRESRRTSRNPQ